MEGKRAETADSRDVDNAGCEADAIDETRPCFGPPCKGNKLKKTFSDKFVNQTNGHGVPETSYQRQSSRVAALYRIGEVSSPSFHRILKSRAGDDEAGNLGQILNFKSKINLAAT